MSAVCGCDPPSLRLPVLLPQPPLSRVPLLPFAPPSIPHPFPSCPLIPPLPLFTSSLISSQSSSNINQIHRRVASICRAALQFHFKVIIACTCVLIKALRHLAHAPSRPNLGITGASIADQKVVMPLRLHEGTFGNRSGSQKTAPSTARRRMFDRLPGSSQECMVGGKV